MPGVLCPVLERDGVMEDNNSNNVNSAILERVERIVEALQDNSIKMGELLAVHNEKLDKQDRIDAVLFEKIEFLYKEMQRSTEEIKKGCERDIRKINERLRLMEKKMWSIAGSLVVISFLVSMPGQKLLQSFLTPVSQPVIIDTTN